MGKLIHDYQLSMVQLHTANPSLLLEERRQLLLTVLPKYTELVDIITQIRKANHTSFKFIFEHPHFEDDTEIELEFEHIIWKSDPFSSYNEYVEADILKNVRYVPLTPNQQRLPFCT